MAMRTPQLAATTARMSDTSAPSANDMRSTQWPRSLGDQEERKRGGSF
jgi:hypothetical protein